MKAQEADVHSTAFEDDDLKLLSQLHEARSVTNERAYAKMMHGRNLTNDTITLSDVPLLLRLIRRAATGGREMARYEAALPKETHAETLLARRGIQLHRQMSVAAQVSKFAIRARHSRHENQAV